MACIVYFGLEYFKRTTCFFLISSSALCSSDTLREERKQDFSKTLFYFVISKVHVKYPINTVHVFTGLLYVHCIQNVKEKHEMDLLLLQRGRLALHVLVDSGEGTFRNVSLQIRSHVAAGFSTMLRVYNTAQNVIKGGTQSQGNSRC